MRSLRSSIFGAFNLSPGQLLKLFGYKGILFAKVSPEEESALKDHKVFKFFFQNTPYVKMYKENRYIYLGDGKVRAFFTNFPDRPVCFERFLNGQWYQLLHFENKYLQGLDQEIALTLKDFLPDPYLTRHTFFVLQNKNQVEEIRIHHAKTDALVATIKGDKVYVTKSLNKELLLHVAVHIPMKNPPWQGIENPNNIALLTTLPGDLQEIHFPRCYALPGKNPLTFEMNDKGLVTWSQDRNFIWQDTITIHGRKGILLTDTHRKKVLIPMFSRDEQRSIEKSDFTKRKLHYAISGDLLEPHEEFEPRPYAVYDLTANNKLVGNSVEDMLYLSYLYMQDRKQDKALELLRKIPYSEPFSSEATRLLYLTFQHYDTDLEKECRSVQLLALFLYMRYQRVPGILPCHVFTADWKYSATVLYNTYLATENFLSPTLKLTSAEKEELLLGLYPDKVLNRPPSMITQPKKTLVLLEIQENPFDESFKELFTANPSKNISPDTYLQDALKAPQQAELDQEELTYYSAIQKEHNKYCSPDIKEDESFLFKQEHINSTKERLNNSLNRYCKEADDAKEKIKQLANCSLSGDEFTKQLQEVQSILVPESHRRPKIAQMVNAFLLGTAEEYKKINATLDEEQITTLDLSLRQFFMAHIRIEQLNKALEFLEEESPKEKLLKLWESSKNSGAERAVIFFEFASKKWLSPLQRTLLNELEKTHLVQAGMGIGKTAILTPHLLYKGGFSIQVVPKSLMTSLHDVLRWSYKNYFGKEAIAIDFSKDPTKEELTKGLYIINEAKIKGHALLMHKETIQMLELKWLEKLEALNDHPHNSLLEEEIVLLGQMQAIFADEEGPRLIIDEVHVVLASHKVTNLSIGKEQDIPKNYVSLVKCIMKLHYTEEAESLLKLRMKNAPRVKPSVYKEKVRPTIANVLFEDMLTRFTPHLQESDRESFLRYVQSLPPQEEGPFYAKLLALKASSDKDQENIAHEIALARGLLSIVIPACLQTTPNIGYTRDRRALSVVPGDGGVKNPSPNSYFFNPYEAAVYHFMLAAYEGVPVAVVKTIASDLRSKAIDKASQNHLLFQDTQEAQYFLENAQVPLEATDQEEALLEATNHINANIDTIFQMEALNIEKMIKCSAFYMSSNSKNFVDQFSLKGKAFSGTTHTLPHYHHHFRSRPPYLKGTEKETLMQLLRREEVVFDYEPQTIDLAQHLYEQGQILKKPDKKLRGFIDVAGIFKDYATNLQIAKCVLALDPSIECVLFHGTAPDRKEEDPDTILLLKKGSPHPIIVSEETKTLEAAGSHPHNTFIIYDKRHHEGANFPQDPHAAYIVTLSDPVEVSKTLQGVKRARLYEEGQQMLFAINKEARQASMRKGKTLANLIDHSIKNQAIYISKETYRSTLQGIDALIRIWIKKYLIRKCSKTSLDQLTASFRTFKNAFICEQKALSPFEAYGKISEKIPTTRALEDYATKNLEKFHSWLQAAGLPQEEVNRTLTEMKAKIEHEIQEALTSDYLPLEVESQENAPCGLEMTMDRAQQTHMQQQVDMEVHTELSLYHSKKKHPDVYPEKKWLKPVISHDLHQNTLFSEVEAFLPKRIADRMFNYGSYIEETSVYYALKNLKIIPDNLSATESLDYGSGVIVSKNTLYTTNSLSSCFRNEMLADNYFVLRPKKENGELAIIIISNKTEQSLMKKQLPPNCCFIPRNPNQFLDAYFTPPLSQDEKKTLKDLKQCIYLEKPSQDLCIQTWNTILAPFPSNAVCPQLKDPCVLVQPNHVYTPENLTNIFKNQEIARAFVVLRPHAGAGLQVLLLSSRDASKWEAYLEANLNKTQQFFLLSCISEKAGLPNLITPLTCEEQEALTSMIREVNFYPIPIYPIQMPTILPAPMPADPYFTGKILDPSQIQGGIVPSSGTLDPSLWISEEHITLCSQATMKWTHDFSSILCNRAEQIARYFLVLRGKNLQIVLISQTDAEFFLSYLKEDVQETHTMALVPFGTMKPVTFVTTPFTNQEKEKIAYLLKKVVFNDNLMIPKMFSLQNLIQQFGYTQNYERIFSSNIFISENFVYTTKSIEPIFSKLQKNGEFALCIRDTASPRFVILTLQEAEFFHNYLKENPDHLKNIVLLTSTGTCCVVPTEKTSFTKQELEAVSSFLIELNILNGNVYYLGGHERDLQQWLSHKKQEMALIRRFLQLKVENTDGQKQLLRDHPILSVQASEVRVAPPIEPPAPPLVVPPIIEEKSPPVSEQNPSSVKQPEIASSTISLWMARQVWWIRWPLMILLFISIVGMYWAFQAWQLSNRPLAYTQTT